MNLEAWCDLDLAYLLIFGSHPDLQDGVQLPAAPVALSVVPPTLTA